jgi:hypothetical protein
LIVNLEGYVDDSGTGHGKVAVLAGFLSTVERWTGFSNALTNLWEQETRSMKFAVRVLQPNALSKIDITRCLSLVNGGGALVVRVTANQVRQSKYVCVVRNGDEIVGVGVIKPPRPHYATGIAKKSGFDVDKNMLELGYVSRDPLHRGKSLSETIVAGLLSHCPVSPLFATTSNQKMKEALEHSGFVQKGKEWVGRDRKKLSLWLKRSKTEMQGSNLK